MSLRFSFIRNTAGGRPAAFIERLEDRRLFAAAVVAAGSPSSVVPRTTALVEAVDLPGPPTNVAVAGVTTSSVTLSWTAAKGDVAGYQIYKVTSSTDPRGNPRPPVYTLLKDGITARSATVDGLTQGTSYTMAVGAYNASGPSFFKTSVTFTTATPPTLAPATPRDIAAGRQMLWFLPPYAGMPTPVVTLVSGPVGMTVSGAPPAQQIVGWSPAADVAPGDYSFTLRAANPFGVVERTYTVKVLPFDTDITPPTGISGFMVDAARPTSVDLSWNGASDDVGVDHYSLRFTANDAHGRPAFDGTYTVPATSTGRFATMITGLLAGKHYDVIVKAFDAAGNGSSSVRESVATPPSPPLFVATANVSGASWTQAFRQRVTAREPGRDSPVYGLRVFDFTGGGRSLPFVNLDTLALGFSGTVPADATAATPTVTCGGASVGVAGESVSPTDSHILVIRLQQPLSRGMAELTIPGVVDFDGAALDVKFNVVPADADGDGKVGAVDLVRTRNRLGATTNSIAYDLFNDFNGDGVIDAVDLVQTRNRI